MAILKNSIVIYTTSGSAAFSVKLEEGSKMCANMMTEDYVVLKFTTDTVKTIKRGYYCMIPSFVGGVLDPKKYIVCDPSYPTYNEETGGYEYEIRLDAWYYNWNRYIFSLNPTFGSVQTQFSYTSSAIEHLKLIFSQFVYIKNNGDNTIDLPLGFVLHFNGLTQYWIGAEDLMVCLDDDGVNQPALFVEDGKTEEEAESAFVVGSAKSLVLAESVETTVVSKSSNEYTYLLGGSYDSQSKVLTPEVKSINYSDCGIVDALIKICSEEGFNCEWWIDSQNLIHLGRCEYGEQFKMEQNVEVSSVSRADSQDQYATKIVAFGSDKNIPSRYRKTVVLEATNIESDTSDEGAEPEEYSFNDFITGNQSYNSAGSSYAEKVYRQVVSYQVPDNANTLTVSLEAQGLITDGIAVYVSVYDNSSDPAMTRAFAENAHMESSVNLGELSAKAVASYEVSVDPGSTYIITFSSLGRGRGVHKSDESRPSWKTWNYLVELKYKVTIEANSIEPEKYRVYDSTRVLTNGMLKQNENIDTHEELYRNFEHASQTNEVQLYSAKMYSGGFYVEILTNGLVPRVVQQDVETKYKLVLVYDDIEYVACDGVCVQDELINIAGKYCISKHEATNKQAFLYIRFDHQVILNPFSVKYNISSPVFSNNDTISVLNNDRTVKKQIPYSLYGFVCGIDLSKPLRPIFDKSYLEDISIGDRFKINGIDEERVPLSAFTDDYDTDSYIASFERRLMLPSNDADCAGNAVVASFAKNNKSEIVEIVKVYDDIYPSREFEIKNVDTWTESVKVIDDDGTENYEQRQRYRFWLSCEDIVFRSAYVKDNDLECIFQTGVLAGITFKLTFDGNNDDGDKQGYKIENNSSFGIDCPNAVLVPKVGDKIVLLNYTPSNLSDLGYISEAEQRLKERALADLEKLSLDAATYTAKLFGNTAEGLLNEGSGLPMIGQKVNLIHGSYAASGRSTRVIGYEYCLDIPYDNPTVILGESLRYSRLGSIDKRLNK